MNVLGIRIAVTGMLLVLTVISGIIVSALGRPLNTIAFSIHKLMALSSAVLTVMVVWTLLKNVRIGAPVAGLIVIIGLFLLSLFVSGAFLSLEKPVNVVLLAIHKVAPIPMVVSSVLLAYLQLRTKI
ncbi:MAG: hypothetical protein AB1798_06410 [Spirochaetota bacterium]